jgi:hypothetical protein
LERPSPAEIHPAWRKVTVYPLIARHQADPGAMLPKFIVSAIAAARATIRAYDFTLM